MSLRLSTPVSGLPGIGDKGAIDFANVGVKTVRDLLWYVPFRYDDYSKTSLIADAPHNTPVTITARIKSIKLRPAKSSRVKIVDAVIEDVSGSLKVIWFNQPFLVKTLAVGSEHSFAGIIDSNYGKTFSNPVHEPAGRNVRTGRIVPVYSLSGGLTMNKVREGIQRSLSVTDALLDWLPQEIVEKEQYLTLPQAIAGVHFPESHQDLARAVERLKFDELFLHQLLFEEVRRDRKTKSATSIPLNEASTKSFVETLPFTLTRAQKMAAWEILKDLTKTSPMNRLLEGDVGSGKTVVAAVAVHACGRSVYLAPTEILAEQQYHAFCRMMPDKNIALLTRTRVFLNQEKIKKSELLERLEKKEIHCLIGTHAVLQQQVCLDDVHLVIVDEQHRFGVAQRHALLERQKDHAPHLLSMTATPIPRSLALTIHGDLDLSILQEMPKGRVPIGTAIVTEDQRVGMWGHVRSEIEKGRQVFVVCPLIDPSDALGAKSVKDMEKMLSKDLLQGVRIGVLHGKLKPDVKTKAERSVSGWVD